MRVRAVPEDADSTSHRTSQLVPLFVRSSTQFPFPAGGWLLFLAQMSCKASNAPLIDPHGCTLHSSRNCPATQFCITGSDVSAPAMKAGQVVAVNRAWSDRINESLQVISLARS